MRPQLLCDLYLSPRRKSGPSHLDSGLRRNDDRGGGRIMRALRVGLTGGIGAGKSLALREFARLGAKTVSLDALAHEAMSPGRAPHRKIIAAFGRDVLDSRGRVNRKKLGVLVFADARARRRLERLTHPWILREMERRLRQAKPGALVVADVPLLFEGRHQKRFDATILVTAPERLRAARVMRRDGLSRKDLRRRLLAQWPQARKAALADVVIANARGRKQFLRTVQEYHKALALIAAFRRAKAA